MSTITQAQPSRSANVPVPTRRRRVLVGVLAFLVLVTGATFWALNRGADRAPYTDPRAAGILTLCDAGGHPITSGSVGAAPFVARAVGTTALAGGARELTGATATLYGYQPRKGLGAGEWSGQQVTAASSFTVAEHPIAQATTKDAALGDFLAAYPATWDGFVQLRLYVATPAFGIAGSYDAVDVKVQDGRWTVAGPAGSAGCTAGDATSAETTTLDYPPATH